MEKEQLTRLTIDLPSSLHRQLKLAAVSQGKSMKEIILECVERELTANPSEQKTPSRS